MSNESAPEILAKLRAAGGDAWDNIKDPEAFLREIRGEPTELSLAGLVEQHGAEAVCELAKEFADARVFGPWEPDLSDPPRMVRKLVGDTSWQPSRVNYISWGDGEWCTHPGWYWWATVGAGAMESNAAGKPLYSLEAAQSACDAALRAAGAVLVDQPKESQS